MNPRILVADDHFANRTLMGAYLEETGYEVVLVGSGRDAVEACRKDAFDLLLLDIVMPDMDGIAACREIRALEEGALTPVVFMSGHDDRLTHQDALDCGADDFLAKPVHRTELLLRVRSLIRIKGLQQELKANYEALLQAQAQNRELTALVVHDLKNPLVAIEFAARALKREQALTDGGQEAIADIIESTSDVFRMVGNWLDLSRQEEVPLPLRRTRVDVVTLAQEAVQRFQRRAADRRQTVTFEGPSEPVWAELDRELIRRVLENLLDNALKHAPTGSGVRVELNAEAQHVALSVADEGPGIKPAMRERIFEKFVQVDGGLGHGLGLAFCRTACTLHGGSIGVEDNSPQGSLFWVRLPL